MQKNKAAFFRKLQLNNKYEKSSYCQGISEVLLCLYLLNSHMQFSMEKKVAGTGNSDVDIQIVSDYTYNIEIKCPQIIDEHQNITESLLIR